MPGYHLAFLWEVRFADGNTLKQSADNASQMFPEILILPLVGEEPVARVRPEDAPPELLAAVEREEPYVLWNGTKHHWGRLSQTADREYLAERSPIVEARLVSVDNETLFAGVWLDRTKAGYGQLQYGDIYLLMPQSRHPIIIPFSLPEVAWPVDNSGRHYPPELELVCDRDVIQDFHDQLATGVIRDVAYKLGWKTNVEGQPYQYTIQLRAPIQSR